MRAMVLVFAVLALAAGGCSVTIRAGRPTSVPRDAIVGSEARSAQCVRSPPGAGRPFREELPGAETDPELLPYLARFSPEVRRTAVAAGVEPLLARLMRERAGAPGQPTPALLETRQELAERVAALPGQLLAVEFECECVAALLVDALEEQEDGDEARERALTIATLVTGAAFGLVAGGWDLANSHTPSPESPDGPLITAIAGGVVTTALGAALLVPDPRPTVLMHEHNLLAPIASGHDDGRLYPTFVFRLLSMPVEAGAPTPREALLDGWRAALDASVADADRAQADEILYGIGGTYDPSLVRLRLRLLQELETALDSLSRQVDALARAIADALARDPAAP